MCTAAVYRTKDTYFGRTLDYEFSYGDEVTITPRNYPLKFRHIGAIEKNYAILGMAHVVGNYPLYYDAINEKGLGMAGLNLLEMQYIRNCQMKRKMWHSMNLFCGFCVSVPRCRKRKTVWCRCSWWGLRFMKVFRRRSFTG